MDWRALSDEELARVGERCGQVERFQEDEDPDEWDEDDGRPPWEDPDEWDEDWFPDEDEDQDEDQDEEDDEEEDDDEEASGRGGKGARRGDRDQVAAERPAVREAGVRLDQVAFCGEAAVTPRGVTRGEKSQVGLDWVRGVGKIPQLDFVRLWAEGLFGKPEAAGGQYFYREALRFPGGLSIHYNGRTASVLGTLVVDVPGGLLACMSGDRRVNLLADLVEFGLRPTRVDVAFDLFAEPGECVGLIAAVHASCKRDELCGCRAWDYREPMRGGNKRRGHSIYLGRRGNVGSGRMVRVYDKGLEMKCRPEGEHERWEVEFTGEVAEKVAAKILERGEWDQVCMALALGAVDFRECNGRRELSRRPRAGWWSERLQKWLKGEPLVRVKAEPREPTLDGTVAWLRAQVGPTLRAMARVADCSIGDVWDDVMKGAPEPKREGMVRQVCWEYYQRLVRRGELEAKRALQSFGEVRPF